MIFKDDGTKVNISDSSYYLTIRKLFDEEGITYKQKNDLVKIIRTSEPRIIDLFYSVGTTVNRIVPEGTLLLNDTSVITEEQFKKKYEPFTDEDGNVVKDMYVELEYIKVIKNPFKKPLVKVNSDGCVVDEGDDNCYIYLDEYCFSSFEFGILTEEQLNKYYSVCESVKQKILKDCLWG